MIPGRLTTAQERFAFLVTGDPQYLAEKSPQPRRLDPYSEVAHQRFQKIIRALPGAKTDSRDPSRGAGLRHGFLYVELIDHPGTSKDRFLVRSYATRDNWETHGWQRRWEKSIRVPDKP